MIYKSLGNTSVEIPAIGQGCMGLGGELSEVSGNDAEYVETLRLGCELGMTLIDTAEAYGAGRSEELVGTAIRGIRDEVFIATKFSPENNTYDGVLRAADRSLRRLQTEYIDLYQVHWPNPTIPIEDTIRAVARLLEERKIRFFGVSNFSVPEMRAAANALGEGTLVSNQVEYNLFDRFVEERMLPYCDSTGMTLIAYSPLDKGRVSDDGKLLSQIAQRYEKTPAQVTLNWITHQPRVVAIPKSARLEHLRENAAATDFSMTDEEYRLIGETYSGKPSLIPVDEISVSVHGEGNRKVYQTLEQALRNDLNFVPSPRDLAADILKGEPIKPVRLVLARDTNHKYDLIEGRIRYWGWVIAHSGKRPVPALIRRSTSESHVKS